MFDILKKQNIADIKKDSVAAFSLIEMLVSLALYTIVSVVTVGALLSLIGGNQRLTVRQTDLSAAGFAFDNMTREIRTGFRYYCDNLRAGNDQPGAAAHSDCTAGASGISLVEAANRQVAGDTGRISYYFHEDSLFRRVGDGTAEKLLPDGLAIDVDQSKFFVNNTAPLYGSGNSQQPLVTILMVLTATPERPETTFQTTITQRALDL